MEMCGALLHIDSLQDYDIEQFAALILQPFEHLDNFQFTNRFPNSLSALADLKEYLLKLDIRFLLGFIIREITISNTHEQDLVKWLLVIPEYIICAFFIRALYLVTRKDTRMCL